MEESVRYSLSWGIKNYLLSLDAVSSCRLRNWSGDGGIAGNLLGDILIRWGFQKDVSSPKIRERLLIEVLIN